MIKRENIRDLIHIKEGCTLEDILLQTQDDREIWMIRNDRIIKFNKKDHARLVRSKVDNKGNGLSTLYDGMTRYIIRTDQVNRVVGDRKKKSPTRDITVLQIMFNKKIIEIPRTEHIIEFNIHE